MTTQKILKDISEQDVDQLVEDFKSEGCDEVNKIEQDNGKWTIEAICPDE